MSALREPSYFIKARRAGRVVVDEPPKLDLEAYIANYKGRTRFERLYLIGSTSSYLYLDALKAALAEAKRGGDVQQYEAAVAALSDLAPNDPDAAPDQDFVEKMRKQVKIDTDKMETELKLYKNNLIKESIRMGFDDLGQHYHRIGDLSKSQKAYSQMRDVCTTPSHVVLMNMKLINVSIDQRQWFAVQNHVSRVRGLLGSDKQPEAVRNKAKLSAANALSMMMQSDFKGAAQEFITADPRMARARPDDPNDEESYSEVLTPNDVAIYGGLCAIASMDRDELQRKVLESAEFRDYLELEPHIRRAISHFINGNYSACLSILDSYKPDYLLDIYLQSQVPKIYYEVRSKAIRQYFIPFSCVTFKALAQAFNTDEGTIEVELTQLIKAGDLEARLDLVDRKLLAKQNNARAEVLNKALAEAKEYERTLHLRLLRMAILNAGLEVKSAKEKGGLGGGGGFGGQDGGGYNGADLLSGDGRTLRSGR